MEAIRIPQKTKVHVFCLLSLFTCVSALLEKYASLQASKTLSQKEAQMRGGPGWIPTSGLQIEHSNNSNKCRQSWLASPWVAKFLTATKAGVVWAGEQHVLLRNTRHIDRSLDPLPTELGGFPADSYGGKRPPLETHTPLGSGFTAPTTPKQSISLKLNSFIAKTSTFMNN